MLEMAFRPRSAWLSLILGCSGSAIINNQTTVASLTYNASSVSLFHFACLDSQLMQGVSAASASYMVGSRGNDLVHPGRFFKGDVSEIIVYNRSLTEAERMAVELYLETQWQAPDTNPNCTVQYDCNITAPYAQQSINLTLFTQTLIENDTLSNTYAYHHAALYPMYLAAFETRCALLSNGTLKPLPSSASTLV